MNTLTHIPHTHTHTPLLELIHDFSKVTGYKINIQNLLYFYTSTSNEQYKNEMMKTITSTIPSNSIKCLINLI